MVLGVELRDIHREDAGRVVHRSALQPGEGEQRNVEGLRAAEGLVLRAACRLVADQVGPGAAQSRGAHRLVGIDHDVVPGGQLHGMQVVVDHPLSVVVFASGQDVAHVAALHGVVSVAVHQRVGGLQVAFVVAHRRGGLVVHHQPHALPVRVVVQRLDVEVGIGGYEVEDIVLRVSEPVLPADVPPSTSTWSKPFPAAKSM